MGNARKRILFVVNRPEYFLSRRLALALAARDAGYDVRVTTPSNEHVPGVIATGLPWREIHLLPGGRNPFTELRSVASLMRCYRQEKPDLVHHVSVKTVLYGTAAARMAGVPAVVNAIPGLGYTFGNAPWLMKRLVSGAFTVVLRHPRMRMIFQNEDDLRFFIARGWARPEESVVIWGSGVDPVAFAPRHEKAEQPPVVMFAARLMFSKGVAEFVEAARSLSDRARFVVVGDIDRHNPDSVSSADVERWRREGVVEFWGHRQDMPDVLAQASIICLPSDLPEGVPKILLEAASMEIPIITSNRPGCRDIVSDGENGLLVPPRNATALAAAIERLLADAEARRRMGRRGRERVLERFTIDRVIADTLEVYAELLGSA